LLRGIRWTHPHAGLECWHDGQLDLAGLIFGSETSIVASTNERNGLAANEHLGPAGYPADLSCRESAQPSAGSIYIRQVTTTRESRRSSSGESARRTAPADARERLLVGLEQSIERRGGYRDTTLTDIVQYARASRRTFYLVFGTKDEALLALVDKIDIELVAALERAVDPRSDWRQQVAQAIESYFSHIQQHPAVYLCAIRELPFLGEVAVPVIRRGNEGMSAVIYKLTDNEEFWRAGLAPAPRQLAMMVIGALNELVADILESERDIMAGLELATAATTALLSTNFTERRTSGSAARRPRRNVDKSA
jgi:AcrR family transcriptional regulator